MQINVIGHIALIIDWSSTFECLRLVLIRVESFFVLIPRQVIPIHFITHTFNECKKIRVTYVGNNKGKGDNPFNHAFFIVLRGVKKDYPSPSLSCRYV